MLKDPIAWLVVRTLGLLLLGYSLLQAYTALLPLLLPAAGRPSAGDRLLLDLVEAAVLAGLAYYFLRRGRAVQRLLVHESR